MPILSSEISTEQKPRDMYALGIRASLSQLVMELKLWRTEGHRGAGGEGTGGCYE